MSRGIPAITLYHHPRTVLLYLTGDCHHATPRLSPGQLRGP